MGVIPLCSANLCFQKVLLAVAKKYPYLFGQRTYIEIEIHQGDSGKSPYLLLRASGNAFSGHHAGGAENPDITYKFNVSSMKYKCLKIYLVISENCCNFIVLKYKDLQTIIAMITEDKVTEYRWNNRTKVAD